MNRIQVATFTHNGRPFYTFATAQELPEASSIAGTICDRLTDALGDGFGYQVTPVDYIRTGPAGMGDATHAEGLAVNAFEARGERPNPPPTAAVCVSPDQARFIGSALNVGSDDESHSEDNYEAAMELIDKLETVAAGGSVVIQVQA